jgi:hypothetical protein
MSNTTCVMRPYGCCVSAEAAVAIVRCVRLLGRVRAVLAAQRMLEWHSIAMEAMQARQTRLISSHPRITA